MKTRTGYVSNSSSSSFIVAYDSNVFGSLAAFIGNAELGCDTELHGVEFTIGEIASTEKEAKELLDKVNSAKERGLDVVAFWLDHDYDCIIDLLKQIGGVKEGSVEIIYYGDGR